MSVALPEDASAKAESSPDTRKGRFARLRIRLGSKWRKGKPPKLPPEAYDQLLEYEEHQEFRRKVLGNAPALLSLLTFAFVVAKVILVANGNTNTALAIVGAAGPVQVISGVIILGLTFIGTGVANVAGYLTRSENLSRPRRIRLWTYYVVLVITLSLLVPWITTITLLVALFVYGSLARIRRKSRHQRAIGTDSQSSGRSSDDEMEVFLANMPDDVRLRESWSQIKESWELLQDPEKRTALAQDTVAAEGQRLLDALAAYREREQAISRAARPGLDALVLSLAVISMLPLVQLSFNGQPWLPSQEFHLTNGRTVTGYLLSYDRDWTNILVDKTRLIQVVKTGDIQSRAVCAVAHADRGPTTTIYRLFERTSQASEYPRCP